MDEDDQVFEEVFELKGGDFKTAGEASGAIKRFLKELGLSPDLVRRASVAIYEAEMNVVAHAYKGKLIFRINNDAITVKVADRGPGIEDIELAMTEGYSTATPEVQEMGFGAGMGLPNMKKNTDGMNIESKVGQGTTVTMVIRL